MTEREGRSGGPRAFSAAALGLALAAWSGVPGSADEQPPPRPPALECAQGLGAEVAALSAYQRSQHRAWLEQEATRTQRLVDWRGQGLDPVQPEGASSAGGRRAAGSWSIDGGPPDSWWAVAADAAWTLVALPEWCVEPGSDHPPVSVYLLWTQDGETKAVPAIHFYSTRSELAPATLEVAQWRGREVVLVSLFGGGPTPWCSTQAWEVEVSSRRVVPLALFTNQHGPVHRISYPCSLEQWGVAPRGGGETTMARSGRLRPRMVTWESAAGQSGEGGLVRTPWRLTDDGFVVRDHQARSDQTRAAQARLRSEFDPARPYGGVAAITCEELNTQAELLVRAGRTREALEVLRQALVSCEEAGARGQVEAAAAGWTALTAPQER